MLRTGLVARVGFIDSFIDRRIARPVEPGQGYAPVGSGVLNLKAWLMNVCPRVCSVQAHRLGEALTGGTWNASRLCRPRRPALARV